MWELLARDKNTIDPEVIDPGGRSVEDSPVKSDFTFYLFTDQFHNIVALARLSISSLRMVQLDRNM
jgi:hypothetical protein